MPTLKNNNYKGGWKRVPFYHTSEWRRVRDSYHKRNPNCKMCGQPGNQVDHIKPIRAGGKKLDAKNLQTLCGKCHYKKTQKDKKRWRTKI